MRARRGAAVLFVQLMVGMVTAAGFAQESPEQEIMGLDQLRALTEDRLRSMSPDELTKLEQQLNQLILTSSLSPEDKARLVQLREEVIVAGQENVADFPPDVIKTDSCATDAAWPTAACYSRKHGFAFAYLMANQRSCLEAEALIPRKSPAFKQGMRDWYKHHWGDDCSRNVKPTRCLVAWCSKGYKHGVAFRPAVEIGAAFGDGFGFDDRGFLSSVQFSAAIGVRAFFFNDAFDVRVGLGIVAVPVETMTEDTTMQGGLLYSAGFGFYNGLFGLGWLGIHDILNGELGNGIVITVDVVSIQNIVGKDR